MNPTIIFQDFFYVGSETNVITNEYAYWNPGAADAVKSANWEMTSGSMFRRNNRMYSGIPDSGTAPNALSTNANNSGIFRAVTKRYDFRNFQTSFLLKVFQFKTGAATPATDWDGIHIFLRYQNEQSLYYASVCRRDGKVLIKKKVPNGPSNGGTYYTISKEMTAPFALNSDSRVRASIVTQADGSVKIQLFSRGVLVAEAIDNGKLANGQSIGAPITNAGATGIRADNCEFEADDFTVEQL